MIGRQAPQIPRQEKAPDLSGCRTVQQRRFVLKLIPWGGLVINGGPVGAAIDNSGVVSCDALKARKAHAGAEYKPQNTQQ